MTITVSDIKLLASARMTDETDGGGPMSGSALQDGAENNVFPDVSSTDRAFGRLGLRKVWPAVLNAGTDTLLGAHVILDDMPDDAAVSAFAFASLGAAEDRAAAVARLEASHWEPLGAGGVGVLVWTGALELTGSATAPIGPGSVVYQVQDDGSYAAPVLILTATEGATNVWAVTIDGTRSGASSGYARLGVPSTTSPRLAATRPVTGTLSIGATYCDVDTLLAPVVPKNLGVAPGSSAQIDIDPAAVLPAGRAVAFRANDGLVIHHTAEVATATYANTNTVNCGRTDLASVRLVGNNGVSIPLGWSVNLASGIVTINDISGWSQPVRVRHTIEEVVGCSRTGYPEVSGGSGGTGATLATAPFNVSAGVMMYCGRPNAGSIRVISKTGQDITNLTGINTSIGGTFPWFGVNLSAGTVTFSTSGNYPISDGGQTAAFIASHSPVTLVSSGTYSTVGAASLAQPTLNRITFNRALTKAFPSGTLISSMLLLGDLQARAGASFSQESWTAVWADARIGSVIAPQYQQVANPVAVTNAGAISERWAIIFTSSTAFRLVGESAGQIATGDINSNFSPINPATSVPYFTVLATGWGSGWSAGNVLRFNTTGANGPTWVARSVMPSAPSSTPDSLTVAVRGDIDA